MNLKISLFNKSIIKSDLKRLWWIAAAQTLAVTMLCFGIYDFLINYGANSWSAHVAYLSSYLLSNASLLMGLQFFVPVITTVLIFGYMNKSSSVSFMHSLPLKRSQLYASHMLSTAVLCLAPIAVFAVIMLIMRTQTAIAGSISIKHILYFTMQTSVYAIFSACFTSLICMLVGNMLAGLALTYVLALLPLYFEGMLTVLCTEFLYGYTSDHNHFAEIIYRSFYDVTPLYLFIMLLGAAVCYAVAVLLYKLRKLESYGEIIAFSKLKPIFTFGVAVCAGFLGFLYLSAITTPHILLLLPFGVVGIIAAHMLIKRQFTLRGVHRPIIIYCIFVLAVFGCFKFDATGFERRIPSADKVESVKVIGDAYYYPDNIADKFDSNIYKSEDVQKVIDMHTYAVSRKNGKHHQINIEYTLKNGRKLARKYYFDTTADASVLEPVMMLHEQKAQKFPVLDGTEKKNMRIVIQDKRAISLNTVTDQITLDKLTAALCADLESISYTDYYSAPWYSNLQMVIYYEKAWIPRANRYGGGGYHSFNDVYHIRPSYTNTLSVLSELGLMPVLRPVDSIKSITLRYDDFAKYAEAASIGQTNPVDVDNPDDVIITDAALISQIYDFVTNTTLYRKLNNGESTYELTLNFTDGNYTNLSYSSDIVPEFLAGLYTVK